MTYKLNGQTVLASGTIIVPVGQVASVSFAGVEFQVEFGPAGTSKVDQSTIPATLNIGLGDAQNGASITFGELINLNAGGQASLTVALHTIGTGDLSIQHLSYVFYKV